MKTAKEKAKDLAEQYYQILTDNEEGWIQAKLCATIALNAVQQELIDLPSLPYAPYGLLLFGRAQYWKEVIEELEKL